MGVREERLSVVCLEIIGGGLFQEINCSKRGVGTARAHAQRAQAEGLFPAADATHWSDKNATGA